VSIRREETLTVRYLSIVQHTQSEWLGGIEDHLEGRGIRFGYFRPFTTGGALPDARVVGDGLILVGGGPWGTATPDRLLPTLEAEVRLVRACLMLAKPVVAFGLGAQVLSLAADGGSEVAPLRLEVFEAERTDPAALAGLCPARFPVIDYGRDRPVPPPYAQISARDPAGRPALFQIGANAFGFVGHPGLRPAMVEDLIMECDEVPENVAGLLPAVGRSGAALEDALVPIMAGLVSACGWM
jgi:GMP synthase-like glutamine amidotransferase